MRPAIVFYDNNSNSLSVGPGDTPGVGLLGHDSDKANAFILEVVNSAARQGWSLSLTEPVIVPEPAIIETTCWSQDDPFISDFYPTISYYEME